jgi:sporulation integral membrane protein YlbJ
MTGGLLRRDHPGTTILLAVSAVFVVINVIMFPDKAFDASLHGLTIWWKIVFPALLPFLVISEIAMAFGLVHALGVLLEPITRRVFRVSGAGGCALAVGISAGQPAGADMTVKLRQRRLISRDEGERLLSLSHLCSPIYIAVVVATGYFGMPSAAFLLIAAHWLSAALAALAVRLASRRNDDRTAGSADAGGGRGRSGLPHRLASAIFEARREDGRPFGQVLGDAVAGAVQTLMMIGGVIMMFSVLWKVTDLSGILPFLVRPLSALAAAAGLPEHLVESVVPGLLEMNLGLYAAGSQSGEHLRWYLTAASALLAWGGLSAHAQIAAMIRGTGLRYRSFALFRFVHAVLATAVSLLLWETAGRSLAAAVPAGAAPAVPAPANVLVLEPWTWSAPAAALALGFILVAACLSVGLEWFRRRQSGFGPRN